MESICEAYGWSMEYTEWAPLGRLLAMRAAMGARMGQPIAGKTYIERDMWAARKRVKAQEAQP